MNIIQFYRDLTNHVKYLQGDYNIDLLKVAILKTSIIFINFDKHMPG